MFKSLTITVSNRRSTKDFVLIEQEPWDPFIDTLTKLGAVAYLNKLLFDKGDGAKLNCSTLDGLCSPMLYVYPSRPDLVYRLAVTWGNLGKRTIKKLAYTEVIQSSLEDRFNPKYPTEEIIKCVWAGDAYNKDGELIGLPEVTIVGDEIRLSEKVYGTMLVTYWVYQHRYGVAIRNRPAAIENKMQSFAYAIWKGGNKVEKIKIPDMAESGKCANGGGIGHFTREPKDPGPVDPEDERIYIDYCTQLPLAD